jgi:uncharacterized membrane protein
MKSKKLTTEQTPKEVPVSRTSVSLFERENILWMGIAVLVIIVGCLLMVGGRSEDPNVFDANEVYSTRRITVAPIVILIGLVLLIVAIFRNPRNR